MGRIVKFPKRKGRGTGRRYRPGKAPRLPKFHTRGPIRRKSRKTWGQAWRETRPWVLFIALVTVVTIGWQSPGFVGPPAFLEGEPEPVDQDFSRCGGKSGWGDDACVVDGDTIRFDERRVRIVGMDTPEMASRCAGEAALAEAATVRLQAWLNEGPFEMVARADDPVDRYGRDLLTLRREQPDGTYEDVADVMRAEGLARSYSGGLREGWCDWG